MKTNYEITYTIVDKNVREPGNVLVLGLADPPQNGHCVELAMRGLFPDYAVGVAMRFYQEYGYVPLLNDDGTASKHRKVIDVGYVSL